MKKHSQGRARSPESRSGQRPERKPAPWSVMLSLHEVPESGRHIELQADEAARAGVAALARLRDLPRLEAAFDVTRHGAAGLRVTGRVSATAGQVCVVTLEPMQSDIDEGVDLVFTPPGSSSATETATAAEDIALGDDAPEPLVDGSVDLGAIATEFLILALDPYPRKPGAVFEGRPAGTDDAGHPFAALAALKQRKPQD